MLWITLALALLISAVALAYVVWPLIQTDHDPVWVEDTQLSELISRKDATLRSIKNLEFDYQVGKVSEEDYQLFNARLRRQAIAYLQQIEKLAPQTAEMDEALEAEIASLRKTVDATDAASAPSTPPAQTAADAQPGAARFCPNCGHAVGPTHRFCMNCGAQLVAEEASVQQPAPESS